MNDQPDKPQWYLASETLRNWAIVGGVVAVFFVYGCPKERVDLKLKEVDSKLREVDERVARATEADQVRLRALAATTKQAEGLLAQRQASLAQMEAKRRSTPSLMVKPLLDQSSSADDVREIRLALQFSNSGDEVVAIREIVVSVSRGRTNPKVFDIINQTQAFSQAKRIRNDSHNLVPVPPPTGNTDEALRQQWAQKIIDEHDKQERCSHGHVFLISPESQHVEWEEIADAKKVRTADHTLTPGESVTEQFDYLLTESQTLHWNWFRFRVAVNQGKTSERVIEFNLPGLRVQGEDTSTVKHVYETSTKAIRWEPAAPLLPIEAASDTKGRKE